jgi:hypothetical protein
MTRSDQRADDVAGAGADQTFRFVATLIVATMMAAMTAYVLSYAVLAPERTGSAHGAAALGQHMRS